MRRLLIALALVAALPAAAQDGRLSFEPHSYVMAGDITSTMLYYVAPDNAQLASLPLAGLGGLNDIYRDGGTLCAEAWTSGTPPAPATCTTGAYVGTVNPIAGEGKCLQLRGLNRRCDLWNAYNQRPLVMEVGHPNDLGPATCPTNPLGQPCVNGYYRVPGDFVGRFFWNDPGYNARILIGRKGERAHVSAWAVGPMYVHPNYSGTFDSYTLWIGWNGTAWGQDCGYMGHRASHMDGTQTGRHVDLTSSNLAECNAPAFDGVNQANLVEYSGNASSFTLSSAYRWAQQMTVRQSY